MVGGRVGARIGITVALFLGAVAGGHPSAAEAGGTQRLASEPIIADDTVSDWLVDTGSDYLVRASDLGLVRPSSTTTIPVVPPFGDQIVTYRLALATSARFSAHLAGSATTDEQKKQNVLDVLTRGVELLNGVFEPEVGLRFELIPNNDELIFLDEATDGYTETRPDPNLAANQEITDRIIGSANYDLGHVFIGGDGGGKAVLGGLGDNRYKAQGVSGATNEEHARSDDFWVSLVAHEIGHQLDAEHTFALDTADCANSRPEAGVEPGSGTTIMSYAGVCGDIDDVAPINDLYFSVASIQEIRAQMAEAALAGVGTVTSNPNAIPTVQVVPAVASFALPPQTPFVLEATGSDADGDPLTYSWEQMDSVTSRSQLLSLDEEPKLAGPLFRSRLSTSPTRYLPTLDAVLDGTTNQADGSCNGQPTDELKLLCRVEFLPTTARTLDFRVTVRDGKGGLRSINVDLEVTGSTPFTVTSPTTRVSLAAGSTQTITWNTADSENWTTPLSTVDILASTDGGSTWSVIADGADNDGSADVTLPNTPSGAARIMVRPENAIFYDVSDVDFEIHDATVTTPAPPSGVTGVRGDTEATVTWTAPIHDGGSAITGYTVTASPGGETCTTTGAVTCTVAGLTNGVSHTFTVRAANANGSGDVSAASPAVTPAGAPDTPAAPTAVAGDGSAIVSWAPPDFDGGAEILGYHLERRRGTGGWVDVGWVTSTNPYTVTGLVNGSSYTFRVWVRNEVDWSDASSASNAVVPMATPGAPTGVSGVRGDSSVAVSWSAPSSTGGSAITAYTVTASPGGATCATSGELTCTVTGLTNGTSYTFTVVATNGAGDGTASTPSDPVVPLGVPGAPTIVSASAGDGQVTVTWSAPASAGDTAITAYTVTASPGGATCATSGELSCTVSGLTNGSSYTFTVVATNSVGDGPASAASAATMPVGAPGAPTGVSGVAGNASVTVSWSAPSSTGGSAITGYTVTASPGGATCTTSGELSCTVSGLTNGVSYTFTVVATNARGASPASVASVAVVPAVAPGAPTGVSGVRADSSVVVSWSAPSSTGGSAITGYTVTASPGGATCATSGELTCTVSGLTNGVSYTFTVVATNSVGDGPASVASAAVVPLGVPGASTIASASAGDRQVTVSWVAPSSTGGSAITGYTVTASPGGATCATSGELSCTVSGLTNGSAYTFTVVATNARGDGPASVASAAVVPAVAPGAPSGVSGVGRDSSVVVSWVSPSSTGGSAITAYTVTASPGGATCATSGELSCTVSGLTNGSSYTFTVVATNVRGDGPASVASVAVVPVGAPGAPTGVSGFAGNARVTVSWVAPSSTGGSAITGYTVTASPGGRSCATAGELTCTVSGLTNGVSYTFTVVATNGAGDGTASVASVAVVPVGAPGAPTGVSGVAGNARVTVSWVAPSSTGGSAITGYTVTASPGGATCATSGELSCTVSGLTNGVSYTFTVVATNGAGDGTASASSSPSSSPSTAVSPLAPPAAPESITAVSTDGAVVLRWTAPSSALGGPAQSYEVSGADLNGRPVVGCATTTLSCEISPLTNGVAYRYSVRASNAAGTGAASPSVTVMPLAPPPATVLSALPQVDDLLDEPVLAAGGEVELVFNGFRPFEWVALTIQSTPRTLNTVQADGSGAIRAMVSVPSDLVSGNHTLSVLGLDSGNGAKMPVTISGTAGAPDSGQPGTSGGGSGSSLGDQASGGGFVPLGSPVRLLDTRSTGVRVGVLDGSGSAFEVQVAGRAGVPVSGVSAVALNVTVVDGRASDAGGFVTVFPCDVSRPDASNLNFISGQTVPNAVVAPLSASGSVCLYVYGTAHLLVDVSGFFESGFEPVTPSRLSDTRSTGVRVGALDGSGSALEVQVAGRAGVPVSGASAVALNVTVVDGRASDAGGFVTVYPCGSRPDASNLNFISGQTVPNAVIAPLSATGSVCVYVYGSAHVLVDVSGFFESGFSSLTPNRLLDTRSTGARAGALDGTGQAVEVQVTGRAGVPTGATAAALNVTVVDGRASDAGGFVTVFPCGTRPDASNLNFISGQTVPNAVIAPLSATGTVCLYVYGTAHLLVDISGHL